MRVTPMAMHGCLRGAQIYIPRALRTNPEMSLDDAMHLSDAVLQVRHQESTDGAV
jgi:hypothetical protein